MKVSFKYNKSGNHCQLNSYLKHAVSMLHTYMINNISIPDSVTEMDTGILEMYDTYSVKYMLITYHIILKQSRQWFC